MSNEQHPLSSSQNWNKPKTWIVPLSITVFVDDPSGYDMQMESFVKKVLNELRSISTNFDKTGKQLLVSSLPAIKDPEKVALFQAGKFVDSPSVDTDKFKSTIEQILKEKGLI